MSDTVIYWFRHDLRLSDLPGLQAASLTGNVIPVFIHDEKLGDDWAIGGASRWWLHHSSSKPCRNYRSHGWQAHTETGRYEQRVKQTAH
jgi:deoxyribodipyrimidine photo-lyase